MKSSCIILLIALAAAASTASTELTVFAAASTADVMKELAAGFRESVHTEIRFNFGSSGSLTRQIDAGAPADVFISANNQWMDWLESRNRIVNASRFDMAGNRLVMIAPEGTSLSFDGRIPGRLAVGDFRSVPSGMYAAEALKANGWLERLRPKLVMAANVRTALLYVERGEVAAGIVYATDAKASGKVTVVGTFPADTHRPIVYHVAAVSDKESTAKFLQFLKSTKAKAILEKHGFSEVARR